MILTVKGMATRTNNFVQLWGMHVADFDPTKHCQFCFRGKLQDGINLEMADNDYPLLSGFPYFYLCAVGRVPKHETNVHLAVRHQPGAVASVGSVYGVTFTIKDAAALRIDRLPEGWRGLPKGHASCRNFQFGVQVFGYHQADQTELGAHSLLSLPYQGQVPTRRSS